jgi:hypothetical protein
MNDKKGFARNYIDNLAKLVDPLYAKNKEEWSEIY